MEKVADRILIYIICISFMVMGDVSMVSIIAMLLSLFFTSMETFFDKKTVSCFFHIVYVIVSLRYPQFVLYIPVMLYNGVCRKQYYLMLLYILPIMKYVFEIPYSIPIAVFGVYMAWKMNEVQSGKERFMQLQEKSLQLDAMIKKRQAEMLEHQHYEIRMATMTERNRIAREIHDNVGHMLSRSILQVGAMQAVNQHEELKKPLEELQGTLNTAMSSIRESVHDLKDDSIDLKLMVESLIRECERIQVVFDYDIEGNLSKNLKYCLIAIIKEALTNIMKHSDATKAEIIIREHPALYQLLVFDNGSKMPDLSGDGIGLENMRERVAAFEGNIRFKYENGFQIFVSIMK